MRGRKPIPTHLKVLRGNPGHQALRPELEPTLLWPGESGEENHAATRLAR